MGKKTKSEPSKKSRNPKMESPPGRGTDARATVSLGSFRAQKLLAPLTAGFVAWFEDSDGEPDEALPCLKIAEVALGELLDLTAAASITSFAASDVLTVMDSLEENLGEDILVLAGALHLYLDFLFETELWTGSVEDYEELHALFGNEENAGPGLPEIAVPEIPITRELAAFESMLLINHVSALLEWIGGGRAVTGTGVLRLVDIEAAAACVGVSAVGIRQRAAVQEQVLPGLEAPAAESGDRKTFQVRSMNEVPVLNDIWSTMVESGLLDVRPTKVTPGKVAEAWAGPSDSGRLEAYRSLATGYLSGMEEAVAALMMLGPALWLMHKTALTLGCGPNPMPVERFAVADDPSTPDDDFLLTAIAGTAMSHFIQMQELDLIEIDSHVRVPQHLIRSVEAVFATDPGDEADFFDPQGEGNPASLTPDSTAVVYQLKVMLEGTKPPVWRRLLVSCGSGLDDVHRMIQRAFSWDDSHLHLFQVGGRRGAMYSCDPEGSGPWEDSHAHECDVVLSTVLRSEGDTLEYTYDLGDDWRHLVTLEKVLQANPSQRVPSCTAGRGMAPMEDSGGVWGWAEMIAAANDAEHSEHEEIREWLGFDEGETLDTKRFDKDEVNEALRILT